jgi:hypothetical protein
MHMMRSMRAAFALCIGIEAVAACGGKGANGDADNSPPAATVAANSSAPAGGTAETPDAPPKVTPFTHGDASLTYGTPMKMKLVQGKLVESPKVEYGEVESIFLEYSPSGKTSGDGLFDFNAGRSKTGGYNVDDMVVNSHGFWRINAGAHCSIVLSQVGASGVRGTITCPGDPKGPTGPITFTATP